MKAVINATGHHPELSPLSDHRPSPLFRVVDRPILFHVLERLQREGIKEVELILFHLPAMIEKALGDGSRWGMTFTYHLTRDGQRPFSALLPAASHWQVKRFLLATGDTLPRFTINTLTTEQDTPTLLYDGAHRWTGWGMIPAITLQSFPRSLRYCDIPLQLKQHRKILVKPPVLATTTFISLKQANNYVLRKGESGRLFPTTARMVEPGVWLSRANLIHPTVEIIPPIFIGEGCQIMERSSIGPNVVIENNSLIDRGSCVANSVICEQSYVGSALNIQNSIVDRSVLVNLELESAVSVQDDFILSHLKPPSVALHLFGLLEKVVALIVGIFLLPITAFFALLWGVTKDRFIKLPSVDDPHQWKLFDQLRLRKPSSARWLPLWRRLQHLPALWNMITGDLHLVGVEPLPPKSVQKLPADWRKLYLCTKVGLIHLTYIDHGTQPTKSEKYASESYYAAHMTPKYDLILIGQWVQKKCRVLLDID